MKKIEEILSGKKVDIVKRCFNLTVEAYPPETSELLKSEKDRFLNRSTLDCVPPSRFYSGSAVHGDS